MKILVTGGLGYIGSHAVVELLQQGFEVVIVDDLSNSQAFVLDAIQSITNKTPIFYPYDLKDRQLLANVFEEHSFDGCIHFAAYKSVGESEEKPLDYYENNLFSLVNLLQECNKHQLSNIIFSSSCTVYGQADQMPIDEETPLKPAASCYGRTKQMGEDILIDYAKAYTKKVSLLRYFNPIGAHASSKIGEFPQGIPNNLLPFVMQTASGIREELKVFGNDYPTPDGTPIRDYIHVVDLAKAHLASLNKLLNSSDAYCVDIYNLGTGRGSSVLEIIQTFEKVNEVKVPYRIVERRAGDITIAYANPSKAERELNWKATTTLDESLRSAWQWQLHLDKK